MGQIRTDGRNGRSAAQGMTGAAAFGKEQLAPCAGRGHGILPMNRGALMSWIADPSAQKPGAAMPAYGHLRSGPSGGLAAEAAMTRADRRETDAPPPEGIFPPTEAMLAEPVPDSLREEQAARLRKVWKSPRAGVTCRT